MAAEEDMGEASKLSDEEAEEENDVPDDIDMTDYDELIQDLRKKLRDDPFNYEMNEQLMELLRKNGDFDELEDLRKSVSARQPLSIVAWKNWIRDYINDGRNKEAIEDLFNKAVFDHNNPALWFEYAQWSTGLGDFDYTRKVMEMAVTSIGLRVDVGALIWQSYLDFEELLMSATTGDEDTERNRVKSIYGRALKIPTEKVDEIWTRFLQFNDGPDDNLRVAYEASLTALDKLLPFETKLVESDGSIEVYTDYLAYEMESGDPGRIQSLFERIVDAHSEDESAWFQYGQWCEKSLKIPSVACRVYERAVRHCPYSCSLWQQTLLVLERAAAEAWRIDSFWTFAKETIATADDGRALYRTYIYLLRRRVTSNQSADYSAVADVFEDGYKCLQEYFGHEWDPNAEYRRNYAFFMYRTMKNIEKARLLWQDILASGSGRLAERWIEAARLEREFGDVSYARKLLYKAINSVSDHPGSVYEYFIQFEREEGTLDNLDKALEKVNDQVIHRSKRPQKVKEHKGKIADADESPSKLSRKRNAQEQNFQQPKKVRLSEEKIVRNAPAAEKSPSSHSPKALLPETKDKDGFTMPMLPTKKVPKIDALSESTIDSKPSSSAASSEKFTVFISNLDFKVTPDKIKEVLDGVVEVRLVYRGASKLHKGYGFVDLDSENHMKMALEKDRVPLDGRPMLISVNDPEKRTGFKYNTGLEKTKVFVRNVHYDCTADQLREIFAEFGEVKDVRIVTHKSGKSKGCAYVEFATDDSASRAIDAPAITLLDRKLSVALSNPPKKSDSGSDHQQNFIPPRPVEGRKTHLQIVPRSVNPKVSSAPAASARTASSTNGSNTKPTSSMSNDQFRKFLAK